MTPTEIKCEPVSAMKYESPSSTYDPGSPSDTFSLAPSEFSSESDTEDLEHSEADLDSESLFVPAREVRPQFD
jgi:hypothetical protein